MSVKADENNNGVKQEQQTKIFQAYGKEVPIVPLIQKIHTDKDAYAKAKGLHGRKRQEFYAALEDITLGIHNGTLSRNVSNRYEDTTGKMQHRKQGKDGLTYALNYVDTLVNTYKAPEEKKKEATSQYNYNDFVTYILNSISPGSEQIQTKAWMEGEQQNEDGTYKIDKRREKLNKIIENYTKQLSDDVDYTSVGGKEKVKENLEALRTASADQLRTYAAQVGLGDASYEALFGIGQVKDPKAGQRTATQEELDRLKAENTATEQDIKTAEELEAEKRKKAYLQHETGAANGQKATLVHKGYQGNDYGYTLNRMAFENALDEKAQSSNFGEILLNLSKNLENADWFNTNEDYLRFKNETTKFAPFSNVSPEYISPGNYLNNIYKFLYDDTKTLDNKQGIENLDDGTEIFLIPDSMNIEEGTFYYYDPKTHAIYKDFFVNNGKNILRKYKDILLQKKALGGVLKVQGGSKMFDHTAYQQARKRRNIQVKKDTEARKEKIEAEKRKPKDQDLIKADHLQMYALGADLFSVVSSILPGIGSVASLSSGLAGTVLSAISDFNNDSVSAWEATGNLLFGLGMDALGIIPVAGTAAKSGKVIKTLKVALPMLASLPALSRRSEIIASAEKMCTDWDSMTNQDWSNIGVLAKLLVGGFGAHKNWKQTKAMVNHAKAQGKIEAPEVFTMKTKSGKEFKVSKEEYLELGKAQTANEAADIIGKLNVKRSQAGNKDAELLLNVDIGTKHSTLAKVPGVNKMKSVQKHDLELIHTPATQKYDFTDINTKYGTYDFRNAVVQQSLTGTNPYKELDLLPTPLKNAGQWVKKQLPASTADRLKAAAEKRTAQTPKNRQGGVIVAEGGIKMPLLQNVGFKMKSLADNIAGAFDKIDTSKFKMPTKLQTSASTIKNIKNPFKKAGETISNAATSAASATSTGFKNVGLKARGLKDVIADNFAKSANSTKQDGFNPAGQALKASELKAKSNAAISNALPGYELPEVEITADAPKKSGLSFDNFSTDKLMSTVPTTEQFSANLASLTGNNKASTGSGAGAEDGNGTNWAAIGQGANTLFGALKDVLSYRNTQKANKKATEQYVDSVNELTMSKLKPFTPEKPTTVVFDPSADYNYNALVQNAFTLNNRNLTADPYLNAAKQHETWNQMLGYDLARNTANAQQMAEKLAASNQVRYENDLANHNTAYDNKQIIGTGNFTAEQAKIQHMLQAANDKNDLLKSMLSSSQNLLGQTMQSSLENELAKATTDAEKQAIMNKYKGIMMPYNPGTWSAKSGAKVEVAKIKRKTDLDKLASKEKIEKMKLRDKKAARVSKMNAKLILKMLDI